MILSNNNRCSFILGMHRSGTSALAGALHMAGMGIGKSVMPPKDDNPLGFFENEKITTLNDIILYDLYSRWNDTTLIPKNWWNDAFFETHKQKFIQILKIEFAGEEDILVKDPRISVLLPFYLDILKSLKILPAFLVCTRDPAEVTASLVKRNHLSPENIQLLWMDHILKAEFHSRNYPRLFVDYHDFLETPLTFLERIKASFGMKIRLEIDNEKKILQFVSKELSHHQSPSATHNDYCHEEVLKLHTITAKASGRDLSDEEISAMDTIRADFNLNFHFYNGFASTFKAKLILLDKKRAHRIIDQEVVFGFNSFKADLKSLN